MQYGHPLLAGSQVYLFEQHIQHFVRPEVVVREGGPDVFVDVIQRSYREREVLLVDGSGRLQTVHQVTNPRYYRLIEAFRDLTGVPMVLNTSFNENEPVVCKPEEALDCFLRTKMDVLVLGTWMVKRGAGHV